MPSDWERVAADPVLLAALRRRYAGAGDPLDRLWWAEHPGEPTPEGVADPGNAVEAARRSLFQREATTTTADEVEREEAAALADQGAARRALAAADADLAGSPAPSWTTSSRRPTRSVLAGAVVAALLIGAGVGFAAGRFAHDAEPPALAVFSRSQRAGDRPPAVADVPTFVSRSSTRFLGTATTSGVAVYGARAQDGRICLIAIVLAARFTASCTTDAGFTAAGLSLSMEAAVDPQNDSGISTLQEIDPHWAPDGRLTF